GASPNEVLSAMLYRFPDQAGTARSDVWPHRLAVTVAVQATSMQVEHLLGYRSYARRLEPELLLQLLERRRGAKSVHADDSALRPDITIPTEGGRLLDGYAGGHVRGENAVPVLQGLA